MQSNYNTVVSKPIRIGGWGFVTGGDISADNLRLVASMDVQVPYYKDSTDTEWRPLLTTTSMASSEYDPTPDNYTGGLADGGGSYAVCIAPSDKNIIYTSYNAFMYRIDLSSASPVATRLNLAAKRMLANSSASRLWNNKIAVHPTLPNTMLVGTMGDGVYFTTNANLGATSTFTQITDVAASGTNPHLVAIDPGNGNYAYITKEGSIPYRISTGLAATGWTALTGGPINVCHMEVLSDGTLVCFDRVSGKLWKLARLSSTWTSYTTSSAFTASGCSFAVNPSNLNQIVICSLDGPFAQTLDGGTTWIGADVWRGNYPPPTGLYMNATDIPSLGNYQFGIYPAKLKFDTTGKLVMWHGTGVGDSTPPSTFVRWDWYDRTKGLEELGLTFMRSIAGNTRPLFGSYDKGLIRMIDLDRFTMKPIFTDGQPSYGVQHCYQIGVASGDSSYIAVAMGYGQMLLGRSKDGGATYATFVNQHPDGAGVMFGGACCSTGNGKMAFIPGNNNKAIYTLDDGATPWQYLNLPGAGSTGQGNWINSTFTKRHPITADSTRPGHALLVTRYDQTPALSVLKTTDHCVNWTVVKTGVIETSDDSQQYWACHLDYIPGKSGELLYTVGPTFVNNHLCYSNTDGVSWSFLRPTEIRDVWFFDYGPTLSGSTYPVVFFYAKVNGVRGVYVSLDFFATTPILLVRFPLGSVSGVTCIGGERNLLANGALRCFIGFSNGGGAYIDYIDQATGT